MARILTLPEDSLHFDECECGHPRIEHYDEWLVCLKEGCSCEKFKEVESDA